MLSKILINDIEVEYKVIHRNIKYPRLEFRTGTLEVIVPNEFQDIDKLIKKHENWIYEKMLFIQDSIEKAKLINLNDRSDDDLEEYIQKTAKKYSQDIDVSYNNFKLRKMKSKWGSCSSNKNLNFNRFLKYLPDKLINYIIFHELAHLKEKQHKDHFWQIVSIKFPDHEEKEKELFYYWFKIQEVTESSK